MASPSTRRALRFGRAISCVWDPFVSFGKLAAACGRWAPSYLALWCVVLLSDALSEPSALIARVTAIVLLAVLTAHGVGNRWRADRLQGGGPFLLFVLLGAVGVFFQAAPAFLFAIAWVVGILGLDGRTEAGSTSARYVVWVGIVGTMLSTTPGLWNVMNQFAGSMTAALFGWAGGGGLGTTASGWSLLLLVAPMLIGGVVRTRARGLGPLGLGIALFVVHAGVGSLCAYAPSARFVVELIYAGLLLGTCIWALSRLPAAKARGRRQWMRALPGLPVLFAAAFVLILLPEALPGRGPGEPRTVLFVDHALLGSWDTPTDAALGAAFSGATFGLFQQYVAASGHRVVVEAGIEDDVLLGVDLAVIINPGEVLPAEAKERLYAFVRSGGGLLVLGDHTNIGGIMDAVNDLTAPLGLSLAFDSAVSLDPGWSRTLRALSPFSGEFRTVEIPVSIGASVSTSAHPAVAPFLVGRRAFSDPGDEQNEDRALLGNLAFDRGERYGDVVLAAVRHLGRGKVALFGDTSPFQNSALSQSHEFTDRLVRWLTNGTGSWRATAAGLLAVLLLVLSVLLLRRSNGILAGTVALVVACGMFFGDAILIPQAHADTAEGATARIDAAHGNLIRWESLHDSGVDGLGVGLARVGFLPQIYHDNLLDPVPSPDSVIVSVAPTRRYSPRETRALLEWLELGGGLILTTGWPQSTVLDSFLLPLGLSIEPIPLGAVRPDVDALDAQPQLLSAWPLRISSEWTALGSAEWDDLHYTVVAERAIGRGWIIVVGDSGVFTTENLEGKGFAFAENVAFLSHLLLRPRGTEDPS